METRKEEERKDREKKARTKKNDSVKAKSDAIEKEKAKNRKTAEKKKSDFVKSFLSRTKADRSESPEAQDIQHSTDLSEQSLDPPISACTSSYNVRKNVPESTSSQIAKSKSNLILTPKRKFDFQQTLMGAENSPNKRRKLFSQNLDFLPLQTISWLNDNF